MGPDPMMMGVDPMMYDLPLIHAAPRTTEPNPHSRRQQSPMKSWIRFLGRDLSLHVAVYKDTLSGHVYLGHSLPAVAAVDAVAARPGCCTTGWSHTQVLDHPELYRLKLTSGDRQPAAKQSPSTGLWNRSGSNRAGNGNNNLSRASFAGCERIPR